jgi:uncharacterized protein (DUF1501 family)
MCAATDRPIAALLKDLKARGLLEDTLVLWNTEFGRMPFSQGSEGRDHNGGTFVGWMAGGGVKGGVAYGESDEWSWKAAHNVQVHKFSHHRPHCSVGSRKTDFPSQRRQPPPGGCA